MCSCLGCLSANTDCLWPGHLLQRGWGSPGAGASPGEKLMKCLMSTSAAQTAPGSLYLSQVRPWELHRDLQRFLSPFPAALTQPCGSSLCFLSLISHTMKACFPQPANSMLLEILPPFLATCLLLTNEEYQGSITMCFPCGEDSI